MSLHDVLLAADRFIYQEQVETAIEILKSHLQSHDNHAAWRKLARCLMIMGDDVLAQAVLRSNWQRFDDPHILELICARVPVAKPHILKDLSLVYFSVPKSGSSSIKDALLVAQGHEAVGELSHSRTNNLAKAVPFSEINTTYAKFDRFAVLRHPRSRLRSYWRKNVSEAGSLLLDARGKSVFYGLNTRPSYGEAMQNFFRYRSVFPDFRHHTDSLLGFIGSDPSVLTRAFYMSELDEIIDLIQFRSKKIIPRLQNMKSKFDGVEISHTDLDAEDRIVNDFYAKELQVFRFD